MRPNNPSAPSPGPPKNQQKIKLFCVFLCVYIRISIVQHCVAPPMPLAARPWLQKEPRLLGDLQKVALGAKSMHAY